MTTSGNRILGGLLIISVVFVATLYLTRGCLIGFSRVFASTSPDGATVVDLGKPAGSSIVGDRIAIRVSRGRSRRCVYLGSSDASWHAAVIGWSGDSRVFVVEIPNHYGTEVQFAYNIVEGRSLLFREYSSLLVGPNVTRYSK